MTLEEIEHRIEKAEADIRTLYSRTNKFGEEMAVVTTKLDNILITLGELKESVGKINSRPARLWDKIVLSLAGAVAAAIAAAIISNL
ncbi:MAG: hypothetical protein IJN81_11360 [Clostridia bacterium]|nr:hypothetical protein [Clostridia bacterium]